MFFQTDVPVFSTASTPFTSFLPTFAGNSAKQKKSANIVTAVNIAHNSVKVNGKISYANGFFINIPDQIPGCGKKAPEIPGRTDLKSHSGRPLKMLRPNCRASVSVPVP